MAFFASAIAALKVVVTAIGGGIGAWGIVNLLEGYGNDNPGAKSQGIKQVTPNKLEQERRKGKHSLDAGFMVWGR